MSFSKIMILPKFTDKLVFIFMATLLILSGCKRQGWQNAQEKPTTIDESPEKPVYASPEGVTTDGSFLYVSNVGKERMPMDKDGDGYIMKLNMDATEWIDKEAWSKIALNAPKGMVIVDKVLYVADVDRLVGIDLKQVKVVAEYDFSRWGTKFLNDVAIKEGKTLFVSATDINAIFELDLESENFRQIETGELNGPNGMIYMSEENKIYCAEWGNDVPNGRIIAIDPPTGKIRVLSEHRGNLDGIAFLRSGKLLVSDWNTGGFVMMDPYRGGLSPVMQGKMQGPADFHYDIAADQLFVPEMKGNTLSILHGPK